jgi:hypothetical protein
VFYPMSAVLGIFCHILLDPINPSVQGDLDLIKSVPEIVRCLGDRRPRLIDETFHMMVGELCAELVRLGNSAIHRATGNN